MHRPPPAFLDDDFDGAPSRHEVAEEIEPGDDLVGLEEGPAQAIADEASAGAYDGVVLSSAYFIDMPGSDPLAEDVAKAVQERGEVPLLIG